ncbi:hypothetical protein ACFQL4_20635 [Halosimplex aquaticum]
MESHGLTESLRETLAVFDGDAEPKTTSEVAEALDLGRRSTYDRLDRLVDRDRLRTKKVGASARVWWRVPADGERGAPIPTRPRRPSRSSRTCWVAPRWACSSSTRTTRSRGSTTPPSATSGSTATG